MLSEHEAMRIAKATFAQQKGSVDDYDVTIERDREDPRHWLIWFERKGAVRTPGGRHAVRVDGVSGSAVFMPGE